jgi:hypothetical protein
VPVAPDRVVVGAPPTGPLRGTEAELIYQNLLQLTASAGSTPSTGINGGATSTITGGNSAGTGVGAGAGAVSPTNRQ